jgi:hypothetical protein
LFQTHFIVPRRDFSPEFFPKIFTLKGGRRECRAPDAPAALCAKVESTQVVTTVTPENARHSPRNGFNGFLRALPGEPGLLSPSPT